MNITFNQFTKTTDKHIIKSTTKAFKKCGGFCPILLNEGTPYNCKHKPCVNFQKSNEAICPMQYWIKENTNDNTNDINKGE